MIPISRTDQSRFVDSLFEKKATIGITRISGGRARNDPFEGKVESNVWKIKGKKLLRRKGAK